MQKISNDVWFGIIEANINNITREIIALDKTGCRERTDLCLYADGSLHRIKNADGNTHPDVDHLVITSLCYPDGNNVILSLDDYYEWAEDIVYRLEKRLLETRD